MEDLSCKEGPEPFNLDKLYLVPTHSNNVLSMLSFSLLADIQSSTSLMQRSSTATVAALVFTVLHGCARRILALSPTLPTFKVAEDFALPAATASSSLRFTASLFAAELLRLLALRCGTACHWRSRRYRLWRPLALDSRRSYLRNHILTFG